jgi:hypothetical protein
MRITPFNHYIKYIQELKHNAKINHFKGWDPYDILNCKFISNSQFSYKLKILLTQINRISPINLRSIIGIKKILNSKAMALYLSSALNIGQEVFPNDKDLLINWLISNKSNKYKEYSIGFTFDITLRGYTSKCGEPSLIITLFAMYAFIQYYQSTHNKNIANYIFSFKELIDRELPKVEKKNILWYSYNFDKLNEVYNATSKVGKYYALLYSMCKEDILLEKVDKILNYLMLKQRNDGSWAYSEKGAYTDGFHTAFVLESIYYMLKHVRSKRYDQMFESGLNHYEHYLIKGNGQPLYFHKYYPPKDLRKLLVETDIRDCAMAIVLFSRLGKVEKAKKVLDWTLQNMYSENGGHFYYFKNKILTNKIEFVRWQAWMLYALSVFVKPWRIKG